MQVHVKNASHYEIFAALTPTVEPRVPKIPETGIPPGGFQAYHVTTGTMNLYIWRNSELIWRGPVPTLVHKPLIFSEQGLYYGGTALPSSETYEYHKYGSWLWIIIAIILILCIWGAFMIFRGRK